MSKRCSRLWEVEAARDGRLAVSAREAHQLHLQHCQDCVREQRELDELGASLRNVPEPGDEAMGMRRLRGQILATAQQVQFEEKRVYHRAGMARWFAGAGFVAAITLAAFGIHARNASRPEPVALHLMAAPGARFTHERRADLEYVELLEGSLNIAFDRTQNPKADLWVHVPDGEIRDFGTKFRVSVAGGHTTLLSVSEGSVLYRRPNAPEIILRAGESYHAPLEAPPPMAASEPEPDGEPSARAPSETATDAPAPQHVKPHVAARKPIKTPSSNVGREDSAYLELLEHVRAGRNAQARTAAEAYLRNFPNGFRRVEVERIVQAAPRGR